MPTPSRAVLGGIALLTAALALAACTSMGQHMAESGARARSAHYAAQGNPQFSDPRLQAVVAKFEADFAAIGLDAEKLGLERGAACPASQEAAFRTLLGLAPEQYRQAQEELWRQVPGYTSIVDPDSVRLATLSGSCGVEGPEGPATVAGSYRTITRIRGDGFSNVTVTDTVARLTATWVDGQRRDLQSLISISSSEQFKETGEGQLAEDVSDWDYLNEIRTAPTGAYTYFVTNPDGSTKYQVMFARNVSSGIYTTTVTETLDAQRSYARTWQGAELLTEQPFKDNKLHGWAIVHPQVYDGTPIPGRRDCYQNGDLVKALECPST